MHSWRSYRLYIEDIEDVKVRVWDSPGVRVDDGDEDGTGNDEKYLRDLESAITEELDVKMNDTLSSRRQGHIQNIDWRY